MFACFFIVFLAPKFLVNAENKMSGNLPWDNFARKIKRFPTKTIHQLSISGVKMLLLTENMGKRIELIIFLGATEIGS